MTKISKRLLTVLLAVSAAVCLAFGVFLAVPKIASADTVTADVTLDDKGYMNIVDGEFRGLQDKDEENKLADLLSDGKTYSLVLPDDVTAVASDASASILGANAGKLVSLTISKNVTAIGNYAFAGCSSLAEIIYADSAKELAIGGSAFRNCNSLTTINIPARVKSLGVEAFGNCISVTQINYSATAATNGSDLLSPFNGIGGASVNISGTAPITLVPVSLFRGTQIASVTIDNVNISNDEYFKGVFENCANLKTVTFGNNCSIKTIGQSCFSGCSRLSSINLGDVEDVEKIGAKAFNGCSSLLKIEIPSGVTSVSADAFSGCADLLEVKKPANLTVTLPANVLREYSEGETQFIEIGDYVYFYYEDKALLVSYNGSATQLNLPAQASTPNNATSYKIHKNAFSGNTALTKVTIPATGVTAIGENAFKSCINLEEINIPASILEVGNSAFAGCTALNKVDMANATISLIGSSMFYGCTSLQSITIPATVTQIGNSAFAGCTALENVTIQTVRKTGVVVNGTPTTIEKYCALSLIGANAFQNCTSLKEITVPACTDPTKTAATQGTEFGQAAFGGCTGLEKVYLPQKAKFNSRVFENCARGLLLITPDKAAYDAYTAPENGKLTYEVDVALKSIPRTSGASSTDIANNNNYYFGVDVTKLPVQEGYQSSVWYSNNSGNESAIVGVNEFNELLKEDGVTEITLYAFDTVKPNVTSIPNKSVHYNGAQAIDGSWFNGWETGFTALYTFEVSQYKDMFNNIVEPEDTTVVNDAGSYGISLVIKNPGLYGQWEEGVSLSVKVTPRQLTDTEISNAFIWGVLTENGIDPFNTVEDGTLVKVVNGQLSLIKAGEATPDDETYFAYNSVLDYNTKDITIGFGASTKNANGNYVYDFIESVEYHYNTQSTQGMHSAYATVALGNNYALPVSGTGNTLIGGIDLDGQNIKISYDTMSNTYSVYKTWFIIVADGNKLQTEGGSSYTIAGWSYSKDGGMKDGKLVEISAPELVYGNPKDLVSYVLYFAENEGSFAQAETLRFSHADFAKYINASMPAGYYTLAVSIKDCEDDEGEIRFGTGITQGVDNDNPYVVNFTVAKASISGLTDEGGPLYGIKTSYWEVPGKTLSAAYTGEKTFGDTRKEIPVLTLTAEDIHPLELRDSIEGNEWAKDKYSKYYEAFEITYRVGTDANYYTLENYASAPTSIGRYTVYYNIATFSYDDTLNDSSNSRYYNLTIRGVIELPVVRVQYTGESWINKIGALNNSVYDVFYLDDSSDKNKELKSALIKAQVPGITADTKDDYTSAGAHWVVLIIKDESKDIATWNDREVIVIESTLGTIAAFQFQIDKASNSSNQNVGIAGWEWGSYDEKKNIPHWSTSFIEEGITYNYMLVSQTDSKKVYYYIPNNPDPENITQLGFDKADAGVYWLKPIASGNDNVNAFDTSFDENEWAEVTVLAATITWSSTPRIDSWKYGDDKNFKLPNGELDSRFTALNGTWDTYFCLADDYGKANAKTYASIDELKDANGFVPFAANGYVYVFEIKAGPNSNYNAWSYPVFFSVLKADNYWDEAPVIHGWSYGDKNALNVSYKPHFGDAKDVVIEYWYVDANGVESPLSGTIDGTTLNAGTYKYRVTLRGSSNYEQLEFPVTTFEVEQADNSWVNIPNIIGWNQGRYKSQDNAPSAEAKFGTVVLYTVKDENGKVVKGLESLTADELNSEKLNALGVGTYLLIAEVAGTANYMGLTAEAHFAVFEDSVGLTGLVVATIVFAVIAIGLAAAAVVLLIRKNKKIEEEFRKMVKSELRRR